MQLDEGFLPRMACHDTVAPTPARQACLICAELVHDAHLYSLSIGGLEDVSRAHASAVYHVLAGCCDDVHLQQHQPHLSSVL